MNSEHGNYKIKFYWLYLILVEISGHTKFIGHTCWTCAITTHKLAPFVIWISTLVCIINNAQWIKQVLNSSFQCAWGVPRKTLRKHWTRQIKADLSGLPTLVVSMFKSSQHYLSHFCQPTNAYTYQALTINLLTMSIHPSWHFQKYCKVSWHFSSSTKWRAYPFPSHHGRTHIVDGQMSWTKKCRRRANVGLR